MNFVQVNIIFRNFRFKKLTLQIVGDNCGKNQFPCGNTCLPDFKFCNSYKDCVNSSMEENLKLCKDKRFVNHSTNENPCILKYNSAGYLQDKLNLKYNTIYTCSLSKCECGQYQCRFYSYCVSIEQICDGISHCLFGDDEEGCCI